MIEIIPAIMPLDIDDFTLKAELVAPFVQLVQLDLMDGHLVTHRTWPYNNKDQEFVETILRQEEGLPLWDQLDYELDLMVENAEDDLDLYISFGAKRLIFHPKGNAGRRQAILEKLQVMDEYLLEHIEIGIAIELDLSVEEASTDLAAWFSVPSLSGKPFISFVQVMGIAQIGLQGEKFDERAILHIKNLRRLYPELTISVDGGVDLDNAEEIVAAGANRLVAGSAIFSSVNIPGTIHDFQKYSQNEESSR